MFQIASCLSSVRTPPSTRCRISRRATGRCGTLNSSLARRRDTPSSNRLYETSDDFHLLTHKQYLYTACCLTKSIPVSTYFHPFEYVVLQTHSEENAISAKEVEPGKKYIFWNVQKNEYTPKDSSENEQLQLLSVLTELQYHYLQCYKDGCLFE